MITGLVEMKLSQLCGRRNSVIMAWYNETNMVTASGSGHRDWEINPGITRVGFGYSGSTIVGHSA